MKITFLIRALDFGGAERQLVALARGLHTRGHAVKVVVFYAGGPLEADLREAGVPVTVLNKSGRWDLLGFTLRLARALRAGRPDVVHGYLGAANIFASLLAPVHRAKVVWGLRATDQELDRLGWFDRLSLAAERRLSRTPALIIANSHAGKRDAAARGFPAGKIAVIPNGVDTDRFRPDPAGRARLRAEFGVPDQAPLIGRIGRIHPQKDYPTFLAMAALVAKERPEARFLIAGRDEAALEASLRARADELGLDGKVIWAGARNDMAAVYSACDLTVSSSSYGEGTPNVVVESLACGAPCVATGSGDSAWALGGHGAVVPRSDPAALATAALDELAKLERGEIDGAALRQSVIDRLSLDLLYERTEAALARLLEPRARANGTATPSIEWNGRGESPGVETNGLSHGSPLKGLRTNDPFVVPSGTSES
jgi:glycosyltransferase involved in cell wall biosynthesis